MQRAVSCVSRRLVSLVTSGLNHKKQAPTTSTRNSTPHILRSLILRSFSPMSVNYGVPLTELHDRWYLHNSMATKHNGQFKRYLLVFKNGRFTFFCEFLLCESLTESHCIEILQKCRWDPNRKAQMDFYFIFVQ